jgi:predicted AAA+ superfamily ATPase
LIKKVYTIDPAFAHRLGSHFSENSGRILENIVFIELLRRGKEVYYHAVKFVMLNADKEWTFRFLVQTTNGNLTIK